MANHDSLFFIAKKSLTKRVPSGLESVFASGRQLINQTINPKNYLPVFVLLAPNKSTDHCDSAEVVPVLNANELKTYLNKASWKNKQFMGGRDLWL